MHNQSLTKVAYYTLWRTRVHYNEHEIETRWTGGESAPRGVEIDAARFSFTEWSFAVDDFRYRAWREITDDRNALDTCYGPWDADFGPFRQNGADDTAHTGHPGVQAKFSC